MKKTVAARLSAALLFVFLASGCASAGFIPAPEAEKILPPASGVMAERAAEFNAVIAQCDRRGAFVTAETVNFFSGLPDELAGRLAMLGINEIYISYDREFFPSSSYRKVFADMAAALHRRGIGVYIALKMSDNLWRRSGNILWRKLIDPPHNELEIVAGQLCSYQASQLKKRPEAAIDGIVFDFDVEFFAPGNTDLPPGQLYGWKDNAYGIGRDNDLLLKRGFAMFDELKKSLTAKNRTMKFGVFVQSFVPAAAERGELSAGKIQDFLNISDFLLIDVRRNSSAEIVNAVSPYLAETPDKKMMLALPLSRHSETTEQALRRRSFRQFIVGLRAVIDRCAPAAGFRGIAFQNFAALEDIWEK